MRPHILVRQEYVTLVDYLDTAKDSNLLVLGQSGIGKTVFLTYYLLVRLCRGLPTIYSTTDDMRYAFLPSGVYPILPNMPSYSKDPVLARSYENGMVLYGLNDMQHQPESWGSWRVLTTESSDPTQYKNWVEEVDASSCYLYAWSWEESYFAWRIIYKATPEVWKDVDQLRTAYNIYGGSARNLFTMTERELENDITDAIRGRPNLLTLFKHPTGFPDSAGDALITINPQEHESGATRRDVFDVKFTSRYILNRLLNMQADQKADRSDEMTKVFYTLFNSSRSRSAAGMLFEGAGHEYLFGALKLPLQVRSLQGNGHLALDLTHVETMRQFRVADITPFSDLSGTDYYHPDISTVAGIDSFALEVNHLGKPTSVVLFQFAVSYNQPVNTTFLANLSVPYSQAQDWKLVFVVPKEMASNYGPVRLDGKWGPRISQYVLGVEIKSLWARQVA